MCTLLVYHINDPTLAASFFHKRRIVACLHQKTQKIGVKISVVATRIE